MTDAHTIPVDPWVPSDTFANRLILIRHDKGLTQTEAADACGLDDGSWSNWENGSNPRHLTDVVQKIHEGLGVDRDWLMWGDEATSCPRCGEIRSRCLCPSGQVPGQLSLLAAAA